MRMEAMILAAGKGSRLRPLTDNRPKALVEIAGQTLLDRNIRKMISFGIKHIVINTHYLGEQIHDYVKQQNYNADIYFSDEIESLLDTGGGLLAAEKYFTKTAPILLHNVDIISNIDFKNGENELKKQNALSLICVSERKSSRHLLFDETHNLCGRDNENNNTSTVIENRSPKYKYAFSGIHFIDPQIFNYFTMNGSFSIIDQYLEITKRQQILPYLHEASTWFDVGKIEEISEIEKKILLL
ncbi:MAG: sugar phosphate nucleotidyltransferase [Bacteroidales bacterium]|nr:sugar phosphate nucleotidyltransferase [Bacteroidales bacterium]